MKNFLIKLKYELLVYLLLLVLISGCAAAIYLFYNPISYTASANLILAETGKIFIINEGLVEDPSKFFKYDSFNFLSKEQRANVEFNISPDFSNMTITVKGKNPSEIAKIANSIAEKCKYEIETNAVLSMQDRKKEQIDKIDGLISRYTAQLDKVKAELSTVEPKFKSLKTEYDSIESMRISLKNQLMALQVHKEGLLRRYTELHPEVISANIEIDSLKKKLESLPAVEGLDMLQLNIDEQRAKYNDIYQEIVKLQQQKNSLLLDLKQPSINIDSYATKPPVPIGAVDAADIYKRFILAGILIGFIMSLIAAAFKDTIISEASISNIPGLPLVATIPFIKPKRKLRQKYKQVAYGPKSIEAQLLFYYDSSSDYVDAYRSLATHLKLDAFKGEIDKKVMLFTSPENKTGKSTVCANLAITLALLGKRVILLDANLNKRSVAKLFGIGAKVIGISDIISGKAKLQDCIKDVTDMLLSGGIKLDTVLKTYGLDRLKILPSGMKVSNFADLLESKEMQELFKQLRHQFDCVVVDSPNLLKSPDAIILSSNADGIFVVSKTYHTSYKDVLSCSKKLSEIKIQFKGSVLICT